MSCSECLRYPASKRCSMPVQGKGQETPDVPAQPPAVSRGEVLCVDFYSPLAPGGAWEAGTALQSGKKELAAARSCCWQHRQLLAGARLSTVRWEGGQSSSLLRGPC